MRGGFGGPHVVNENYEPPDVIMPSQERHLGGRLPTLRVFRQELLREVATTAAPSKTSNGLPSVNDSTNGWHV